MIRYARGDIIEADAEALVNTVNCVGVMGRGSRCSSSAPIRRTSRPTQRLASANEIQPGRMFVFETGQLTNPRYIINFPTKGHWRGKSRIEHIEAGLERLVARDQAARDQVDRGPAAWERPGGTRLGGSAAADRARAGGSLRGRGVGLRARGRARPGTSRQRSRQDDARDGQRSSRLMARYFGGLLDPIGQAARGAQAHVLHAGAGEPLQLRFAKAWYGPFAENLRHVLLEVEGHLISGYGGEGDSPDAGDRARTGAAEEAKQFLVRERRRRSDSIGSPARRRLRDPVRARAASTVHWLATDEIGLLIGSRSRLRCGRGTIGSVSSRPGKSSSRLTGLESSAGSTSVRPRRATSRARD